MTRRILQVVVALSVVAAVALAGAFGYRQWQASRRPMTAESDKKVAAPVIDGSMPVRITRQARANLGLTAQQVKPATYWRTIEVPGVLIDRPGVSDRGVIAPVTGVVSEIYAHPGQTLATHAPLFKLRITSESLPESQRELFRASREIEIARQLRQRLEPLAKEEAISPARIREIENQIQRAEVNVAAYRQELLARGLTQEQIDAAAKGEFVTQVIVRAPEEKAPEPPDVGLVTAGASDESTKLPFQFEFQELEVSLGQQVEAGQVLCHLADHRTLFVEGRGFKDDMPLIQQAAKDGNPVDVIFEEKHGGNWPPLPSQLRIHHLENTIDTQTRTFGFYLVLENQWQVAELERHTGLLWRFRPGDRVRLQVAVDKLENVFVLPAAAVVREGPEAYVFRQNGDLFDRLPVHLLAEDRANVVVANDGSVKPGSYIAQNSAASLNRVLKAQMASGQPTNVHVHADGTVHAAH